MKRTIDKGRRHFRYVPGTKPGRKKPAAQGKLSQSLWRSLERLNTMGLRMAGFLHQFKTPLHIIQSQTEFLLDDPSLSPQIRQSLEMIKQNAGRLTVQTRSMMEASRGTRQGVQVVPVERVIEEICHSAQVDCRKQKIELEKDIEVTSPIRMDTVALEGALHNLVNNAIEAMPEGGVLKIKTFESSDLHHVGVEIQDNGAGMSKDDLARIRKPFQTTKSQGTGLGVYITRHILRRHHAKVRWESKPGEGTKVTVLFPVVKS